MSRRHRTSWLDVLRDQQSWARLVGSAIAVLIALLFTIPVRR